jgi:acyl-CoA dehydrogenase
MWHSQRTLRLADGPDEVHHQVVGRAEAKSRESDRAAGNVSSPNLSKGRVFTGP